MDKYVIAFIDLLGSKSKITNDTNDAYFQQIYQLYKKMVSTFKHLEDGQIKTKIFSDNIIFARQVSDEESKSLNLHQMTCIAAMFQLMSIIQNSWLVRGGITFGDFFIDDIMVWGNGLVEAYNLESEKQHLFPTIVLSDSARDVVQKNSERFQMVSDYVGSKLFVDYLQFKDNSQYQLTSGFLKYHHDAIIKMFEDFNRNTADESVIAKLYWLRDYHNATCIKQGFHSLSVDAQILSYL